MAQSLVDFSSELGVVVEQGSVASRASSSDHLVSWHWYFRATPRPVNISIDKPTGRKIRSRFDATCCRLVRRCQTLVWLSVFVCVCDSSAQPGLGAAPSRRHAHADNAWERRDAHVLAVVEEVCARRGSHKDGRIVEAPRAPSVGDRRNSRSTEMASVKDTATFFAEGTASQFDHVLKLYPQALRLKADRKTKKPEELIKLDNW